MLDVNAIFAAHPSAKAMRREASGGRVENYLACAGCGVELPWGRAADHVVMRRHLADTLAAALAQNADRAAEQVMVVLGCEVNDIEDGGTLCLTHEVESPDSGPRCALAERAARAALGG